MKSFSSHTSLLLCAVALTLPLSGCVGPLVTVQTPEQVGTTTFEKAVQVQEIDRAAADPRIRIGLVEGHSCKNKLWDSPATAEAARLQLKVAAAARGATAVRDVVCKEGGTSLNTNCWQSFTCTGEALK